MYARHAHCYALQATLSGTASCSVSQGFYLVINFTALFFIALMKPSNAAFFIQPRISAVFKQPH